MMAALGSAGGTSQGEQSSWSVNIRDLDQPAGTTPHPAPHQGATSIMASMQRASSVPEFPRSANAKAASLGGQWGSPGADSAKPHSTKESSSSQRPNSPLPARSNDAGSSIPLLSTSPLPIGSVGSYASRSASAAPSSFVEEALLSSGTHLMGHIKGNSSGSYPMGHIRVLLSNRAANALSFQCQKSSPIFVHTHLPQAIQCPLTRLWR